MLTTIKLNNLKDTRNTMRIETSKNYYTGKIETKASVCKGDIMMFEFQFFYDFLKTIVATEGRATKKRIAEQHQEALNQLVNIMLHAKAHYANKGTTLAIDDDVLLTANNYVR
jgi:hypothetical protein